MSRKTVDVEFVVQRANAMLASDSSGDSPKDKAERMGVCFMVETVLFETHNYKGFSYLSSELDNDGNLKDTYDGSRRHYFYNSGVKS